MTRRLDNVPVGDVERDPNNPRLVFPEEELARLTESIDEEGVLVPIVVYEIDDKYHLVDGERRWICAGRLGHDTIPAIIVDPPKDEEERLLQMFNIHMVREPWQDMPTAWALSKVIDETGIEDEKELSDLTGLSRERIKRLRHALDLPNEYQEHIHEGRIPLNFFWELKKNVIDPLANKRPNLFAEFEDEEIVTAFVNKRLDSVVTDTVSLRDVRPIINMAEREAAETGSATLDDTIRNLIRDPNATIDDAYEDTVMVMVEADKLKKRSDGMIRAFERLLSRATSEEREMLVALGQEMIQRLEETIE